MDNTSTATPLDIETVSVPVFRTTLVSEGWLTVKARPRIKGPEDAEPYFRAFLAQRYPGLDREILMAMFMDGQARLIGMELISMGDAHSTMANPGGIIRAVLEHHASSFAICHNHIGDNTPSNADNNVTMKLNEAAKLMDLHFAGHMVIGSGPGYKMAGVNPSHSPFDKEFEILPGESPRQAMDRLAEKFGPVPDEVKDVVEMLMKLEEARAAKNKKKAN